MFPGDEVEEQVWVQGLLYCNTSALRDPDGSGVGGARGRDKEVFHFAADRKRPQRGAE